MRALPIFFLLALGGIHAPSAFAADAAPSDQSGAEPCVEAEVNGVRSRSFACLTQKLQPAKSPQSSAGDPNDMTTAQQIAGRPSNQLGLFNYSAMSHRMGNQFGVSVFPQRPAPQPPPSFTPHINH